MEEEVNIYWDKRTLRPNYVSCQAICAICIRLLSFRWRQVGGIDFHLNLTFFLRKLYFESNVVHLNWHFLEICHSYSSFCSSRGLEDINYLAILWDIFIFAKILYQRDKESEGIQSLCSRKIPFVNPKIIAAPCKASLFATLKI